MMHAEGKTSKEFKSIQLRNHSLTVDYVTDADEGYYMCTANNGIGAGLKKIIHINVNGMDWVRIIYAWKSDFKLCKNLNVSFI